MAIRTTLLGGTDFIPEPARSSDLNNTFSVISPAGFDLAGGSNASIGVSQTQIGSDLAIPSGLISDSIIISFNCSGLSVASSSVQTMSYYVYHWDGFTETLIEQITPVSLGGSSFTDGGDIVRITESLYFAQTSYTLTAGDKSSGFSIRIKAAQNSTAVIGVQTGLFKNLIVKQVVS